MTGELNHWYSSIKSYSILFHPIPSYSILSILPIPFFSALFDPIQSYTSYSILCHLIRSYSILFNPIRPYSILFHRVSFNFIIFNHINPIRTFSYLTLFDLIQSYSMLFHPIGTQFQWFLKIIPEKRRRHRYCRRVFCFIWLLFCFLGCANQPFLKCLGLTKYQETNQNPYIINTW